MHLNIVAPKIMNQLPAVMEEMGKVSEDDTVSLSCCTDFAKSKKTQRECKATDNTHRCLFVF